MAVRDGMHDLSGEAGLGESWRAAARRLAGGRAAGGEVVEPVPDDLSAEVKRFVVDRDTTVTVRVMTHDDLDDAVAWRSDPVVRRWWSEGELADPGVVREKYAERIEGRSPTTMWVVEVAAAAGFVQDYRLVDHADYSALVPGLDPETVGVDYAIGDPRWRGRGLGPRVLWAWALLAHQRRPAATSFFAAPDQRNLASLRILEKAGFARGPSFEEPQSDGPATTVVGCTLDVRAVLG